LERGKPFWALEIVRVDGGMEGRKMTRRGAVDLGFVEKL